MRFCYTSLDALVDEKWIFQYGLVAIPDASPDDRVDVKINHTMPSDESGIPQISCYLKVRVQ